MAEPIRSLVVDDEEGIRFVLEETLRKDGHDVTTASGGEEALDQLRDTRFDLAIVDLKLGGRVDGIRVLQAIRWRWPGTAVIILTAYGTLDSALDAIREDVDGYLLKPAHPDQVRQAAREALRRRGSLARLSEEGRDEGEFLEHGPFSLDMQKHLATRGGEILDLTPQEFNLLAHLVRHPRRVCSPQELVEVVRDYEPDDTREAREIIKWYIHSLRRKIEPDPANPVYVKNVRGVGYLLEG
jgi:DNA-binding response OmpR family regulator